MALGNGQTAGRGDWIVTRHNQYDLKYCGGKDFVRNGATWDVVSTHADGSLKVKSRESGGTIVLPADYVAKHVELAYAATVHRCQGMTVDTAHPILTGQMTRDALYVAATRAALTTTLYAITHSEIPADTDRQFDRPKWDPDATAAREVAEQILAREPDNLSATETDQRLTARSGDLHELVPRYRTATDMAADHHYADLITRVLTSVLDAEHLADIEANGRGALAGTLAKAEAAGWNPEQILTLAIARGPVDDAGSVSAVLIGRINGHMDSHTPPPAGAEPRPDDLDRYRELLRPHYPEANLDTTTALHPGPVRFPVNAAHEAEPTRAADRYRTELADIFGSELADRVTAERAWPAVIGSLRRAEEAGQYSAEALYRAAAQRDFDGLDHIAPNLAWRIERQTRLIELDPTHAGQAWTVKAWENAGGNPAELIDELAPDRSLTGLALEAGHELTWHQRLQAIEHAPHPLPWATTPTSLHTSVANSATTSTTSQAPSKPASTTSPTTPSPNGPPGPKPSAKLPPTKPPTTAGEPPSLSPPPTATSSAPTPTTPPTPSAPRPKKAAPDTTPGGPQQAPPSPSTNPTHRRLAPVSPRGANNSSSSPSRTMSTPRSQQPTATPSTTSSHPRGDRPGG
ncbi:hypothetical protein ACFQS3_06260 [Glycomyces mayteni]|uniref:UvrD-like helicase C-terminal domain-containing protein n=1 Tax=Glycomyces mayteni TaxID=543887 RepID=A0ABW2D6G9_9ACTN